jgi:hypothetical protein
VEMAAVATAGLLASGEEERQALVSCPLFMLSIRTFVPLPSTPQTLSLYSHFET